MDDVRARYRIAHYTLLTLWSACVDSAGYDKAYWKGLSSEVDRHFAAELRGAGDFGPLLMPERDPGRIPPCIKSALDSYRLHHLWPGDTTRLLLSGDVLGAFARADDDTRAALPAILAYVLREMPAESYGSAVRVRDWLNVHAVRSA